jgi:hypothetical protein
MEESAIVVTNKKGQAKRTCPSSKVEEASQEEIRGRDFFISRRSSSLARLRSSFFLLLNTFAGGGIRLRTRASPGGIAFFFFVERVNAGSFRSNSPPLLLECHVKSAIRRHPNRS